VNVTAPAVLGPASTATAIAANADNLPAVEAAMRTRPSGR
jgi:hypothetical protein